MAHGRARDERRRGVPAGLGLSQRPQAAGGTPEERARARSAAAAPVLASAREAVRSGDHRRAEGACRQGLKAAPAEQELCWLQAAGVIAARSGS
jgi:hypothetical protein